MAAFTYLPYEQTGRFPRLALDYLSGKLAQSGLYAHTPDYEGIAAAIAERKKASTNRALLQERLRAQYEGLELSPAAAANIDALDSADTFTVCTAHQPNLLTGYLYFIYKILHAVKLASDLTARHPGKQFVPVFYIGSEDADLEELGVFKYEGKAFRWDGGAQTGAVGRMKPEGLKSLFEELFRVMGPPGAARDTLEALIREAYGGEYTIAGATRFLVNALVGHHGLLVIDGDDAALKRTFVPVMRQELLQGNSHLLLEKAKTALSDYGVQATGREINLFYLQHGLRARIEKAGDAWAVAGTDIRWSESELLSELDAHPDSFSPNVVLRPLYQETILPNIAFIGGGAEVSYWLQLREVFAHHKVPYPVVLLRQSVWYTDADLERRLKQLGMQHVDVFSPAHRLQDDILRRFAPGGWETSTEQGVIKTALASIVEKAAALPGNLEQSAQGTAHRVTKLLERLDQKMLRAHKKTLQVQTARLEKVLAAALPGGGLQERTENFITPYLQFGPGWIEDVLAGIRTDRAELLIMTP